MKKKPLIILTALSMLLSACNSGSSESTNGVTSATTESTAVTSELTTESASETTVTTEEEDNITPISIDVDYLDRPNVLAKHYKPAKVSALSATAMKLKPNSDLSNVYFGEDVELSHFDEKYKEALAKNGFALTESWLGEFFEVYEDNRYWNRANYVTVDSLMHTYHLYFAHLLKKIEKEQFADQIKNISLKMLKTAEQHCEKLKGTEWEQAALTELAFFAVGAKLSDPSVTVPASVADAVQEEIGKIYGENIDYSAVLSGVKEDYSQYKPRGYYDGDQELENYFRAMMWYGRMNFTQTSEELNRSALLMTMNLRDTTCYNAWSAVYEVTSFFVGQSDDLGFYEYLPCIDDAYGVDAKLSNIVGNEAGWNAYLESIKKLRGPEINSMVFEDNGGTTDRSDDAKGFRLMGQRFTMDAAVFSALCYSNVKEAADGDRRMLPDGLDVPAAMGSDLALDLLKQKDVEKFPNFMENMEKMRRKVKTADTYWSASLYGGWLHTLQPLLEKGQKDVFLFDNTHWSYKGSEAVGKELSRRVNLLMNRQ